VATASEPSLGSFVDEMVSAPAPKSSARLWFAISS
jgi:hypothetical protein